MVLQTNSGSIIPLSFLVILNHLRLLKIRNSQYESQLVNISNNEEDFIITEQFIPIEIDEKDGYLLDLKNVLVVMSQGNYLEVYTLSHGQLRKDLIRCTMTSFEDQVLKFPIFFRCHRTCLLYTSPSPRDRG